MGQFYVLANGQCYNCIKVEGNNYTWNLVSGLRPQIVVHTHTGSIVKASCEDVEFEQVAVDNKAIIMCDKLGTWSISSTKDGVTKSTEVNVEKITIYEITLYAIDPVLNNNTWATIRTISDLNKGNSYWSIGDAKAVTVNGVVGVLSLSTTFWAFILGFNHNSVYEGTNRIYFLLGRRTQNYSSEDVAMAIFDNYGKDFTDNYHFIMSTGTTNYGSWGDSVMRRYILYSTSTDVTNPNAGWSLMKILPEDLRKVLKIHTTYTANGTTNPSSSTPSYDNTIQIVQDYLWILSGKENSSDDVSYTILNIESQYTKTFDFIVQGNTGYFRGYQSGGENGIYTCLCRSPSKDLTSFAGCSQLGSTSGGVGPVNRSFGFTTIFCV